MGFIHVSGMDDDRTVSIGMGAITLGLGAIALALGVVGAALRTERANVPGWFLIAAAGGVGLYRWLDIHNNLRENRDSELAQYVEVGWGLQLLTVSAIAAVALVPIIIGLSSFRISVRE